MSADYCLTNVASQGGCYLTSQNCMHKHQGQTLQCRLMQMAVM